MDEDQQLAGQQDVGWWRGLRELYASMSPHRRTQFYLLLAMMVVGAVAELGTIGAVLPFLALLADPHRIDHIPLLAEAFNSIGAVTSQQRLVASTALFVLLAVVSAIVRLYLSWTTQTFVFGLGHDMAVEIQRRLLFQPYSFHINQNTSGLIAALEKVGVIVFNVLQQGMQSIISAFIAIVIIAGLIYIDPLAAISAALIFSVVYYLVSAISRRRLRMNSDTLASSYDERVKIIQESLGGIRDVIIDSSQSVYLEAFRSVDRRFNVARANTSFIGTAPRFIIEGLGMILIALLAGAISGQKGGFAGALPVLGALALGAQRLLPLVQQVYLGWSIAAGHGSVVEQVLELLRLPVDERITGSAELRPLPFHDRITVDRVSFAYQSRPSPAIDGLSLEIPAGRTVALIGKTGGGKSTLADLLMGLIEPNSGRILVDGVPLTRENRRSWQRSIAHVPQAIFLADASIARNIALGVPAERVDLDRVIDAARKAQLDEFVGTLPAGYDTHVGERGVRLSGGQRQRLGIARAIYKQAPVLVLDEATSALDDATEAAVMQALDALGDEGRTIIMIAHRLSSVARADMVVRLDEGRLLELGSYAQVVGGTPQARVF